MIEDDPLAICKDIARLQPEMRLAVAQLGRTIDFRIVETYRSQERQDRLFAEGKSKTHNSKHKTGMAVDIYPVPNGYQVGPEEISKIHETWLQIAAICGYPKTKLLAFDPLHLSLNDGKHI